MLLIREGWDVGKDLVYRLYKEEGLILRKRPVRRKQTAATQRQEKCRPTGANQVWAWTLSVINSSMGAGSEP